MASIKIKKEVDWLLLDFDYHLDFIEDLKALVPPTERDYDPETHLWRVDTEHAMLVIDLAKRYFTSAEYEFVDDDGCICWQNLRTNAVIKIEPLFK